MRWKAVLCIGWLVPGLTGCNVFQNAAHNIVREPVDRVNQKKLTHRLRGEARLAWKEVCHQFPARSFSKAFADGFEEGYADHLQNGGAPQAPAVPPPRYRSHPNAFTPEGHAAARDYMIGFKYGAEVACSTGRREFMTVPVLLPNEPSTPPSISLIQMPSPPTPAGEVPVAPSLAAPRAVPAAGSPPPAAGSLPVPPTPVPVEPKPAAPPKLDDSLRPEPVPLPKASAPPPPAPVSSPLRVPPPPATPGVPVPYTPPVPPPELPPSPSSRLPASSAVIPAGATSRPEPAELPSPVRSAPPPLPPAFAPPPPLPPAPSPG